MPNGFRSAWLHKLCSAARRFALIGTGNEPGWSPAPAISRHILRRNPDLGRRRRRLPEHVDRTPPARIPIAADAETMRLPLRDQPFGDADGTILMEGCMVRSVERRVGNECDSTCRRRWWRYN